MTIREFLRKQKRTGYTVAGISWIGILTTDVLLTNSPDAWLSAIPGAAFVLTCFYFYFVVQCPKCRTVFGPFAVWSIDRRKTCPHCGVDFDGQLDTS